MQHSLSRSQVVTPFASLSASNAQLASHTPEQPNQEQWAIPHEGSIQLRSRLVAVVPPELRHLLEGDWSA